VLLSSGNNGQEGCFGVLEQLCFFFGCASGFPFSFPQHMTENMTYAREQTFLLQKQGFL
jgi:hypothetical protein